MKKLIYAVAALAAVSLAACGNGEKDNSAADSDTVLEIAGEQTITPVDTVGDTVTAVVNTVVEAAEGVVPANGK